MKPKNHNWEWEEKPREPIGVFGCLVWLACWGFIFYAILILIQDV